jgi:sugar/nucleoside kinase (ribokinase family)
VTVQTIAVVGVHVLDTHVLHVEAIPSGSDGALVETIRFSPAGTAGGTGVVLSRLGADVHCLGAVGDDPIGEVLLTLLGREGLDTTRLQRIEAAQTSASVLPVRPNGDRPAWHCVGANGSLDPATLDLSAIPGLTHVHLGGPEFLGGPAAGDLLAAAKALGCTTSVDVLAPGDPDLLAWIQDCLPHTDYLLPNDEQVLGFTGAASLEEGARALVAAGVGCVAVTQGAKGALVVTGEDVLEVAAYAIDVVDTTGCGDAFSAGFLRGLGSCPTWHSPFDLKAGVRRRAYPVRVARSIAVVISVSTDRVAAVAPSSVEAAQEGVGPPGRPDLPN